MSSQGGQGQAGAQQRPPPGPPYPPQTWSLGGRLEESVDIPVTAVFLALYIVGAIGHMALFKKNQKQGHKFLLTLLIFGFCMCRVVTCILRIASATRPTNIQLAIAAQIFVAAGVLLIYIINLIFTQRMIRAQHPRLGWSFRFGMFFKLTYVVTALTLIMVITVTVQSFYTLSINTRRIDRDIQLYCSTFFAYVSFLPIPLTLLGLILPRKKRLEKFGIGRWRSKIIVLLLATFILCLGAAFRCATAYLDPVPMTQPLPSYYSKACFYIFNFALEILVIYLYLAFRVDRRFHIPNGAKGPGQYARGPYAPKTIDAKRTSVQAKKHDSMATLGKASTLDEYDPSTPRKLNLKTDFSAAEKKKIDLEAQSAPHSAISGTTAALSKDHLLLPESPKPVHVKSDKYRSNADVPPVPALPPSAAGAIVSSPTPPNGSSGAASTRATEDKLDKVVDLLVTLDRRLSNLEEAPRRNDLLERLTQRLSRLEDTDPGATPRMRPQSSAGTTLRGSVDNAGVNMGFGNIDGHENVALGLLDRLDRRLARLEEQEARMNRASSGFDGLMMLDRRLSRMESRITSPDPGFVNSPPPFMRNNSHPAADYETLLALGGVSNINAPLAPPTETRFDRWNYGGGAPGSNNSPRLRGGAGSPQHRFSQSPSRFAAPTAARASGPLAETWPLDEAEEHRQQQQRSSPQNHPTQLRPGYARAPASTDSMGTVTLNAQDDYDDDELPFPPTVQVADVGRAYTPDDNRPHRLSFGRGDINNNDDNDGENNNINNGNGNNGNNGNNFTMLGVAREQPLRYSTSVASATSQYSQATEVNLSDERGERERPRTAYVVDDVSAAAQQLSPAFDGFPDAQGSSSSNSNDNRDSK
ncbi:Family c-likeg-protein-coupled receptor protein [Lasiodiplodia theobromae]|uniref:Family c-likeg-protein-coupled receptor protein n=1 Tax=Lasiodiplodia theobromae TaxID=45133 RepID=UPI0015C390A7|nr:Family c-likeg-protein-coupled receptor protein [Lasiodiplodia theobromae]KAF4542232.1 Family c-likeg-protein-coupled receptor protein [Lasiodiplodia theobromae]